jgi:outer membrane protein TolC
LAVQRFRAEVQKNQSERVLVEQEIIEVENKLNRLVGRFPQSIERGKVEFDRLSLREPDPGIPSQLLKNRSDIRQAELELAAAGLDVEVARARFFPTLELKAGLGFQAFNTKYLVSTPESLAYGLSGELIAPVLNRKAIKASYLSANANQLQKVYDYQQTVLKATTEVVNQMSRIKNYGKNVALKREQLASLEASVENANQLFQNARAEYMEVLLAQRGMMEARIELIEAKQKELAAIVQTYQALGGGGRPIWDQS